MGFYRRFIKAYATIASPLTHLLTKEKLEWSLEAQEDFDKLKDAVSKAPTLLLPNFSQPFILEIDTSGVRIGAILSQQGHPIAFFSKPLHPKLFHASTFVQELCAIMMTVKKWRQYLLGHYFVILIDHRSLKELMS